jgi:hypothetical protein
MMYTYYKVLFEWRLILAEHIEYPDNLGSYIIRRY